jgi:hypothetical protein
MGQELPRCTGFCLGVERSLESSTMETVQNWAESNMVFGTAYIADRHGNLGSA